MKPISLLRSLAILVMAGALGAYILAHSPLRDLATQGLRAGLGNCWLCINAAALQQGAGALAALWLVFVGCCAGWLSVDQDSLERYEKPLVFGLSAFGWIVIPAAALGELSERLEARLLSPPGGPLLVSLPAVVFVAIGLARGWRPRLTLPKIQGMNHMNRWIAVLGGGTLLASVAIGLMHPATSGDALSYHGPLSVYLWQDGNLGTFLDRAPDIWALAHPGTAELWFGLLRIMGGEGLAKLGQLPFALLGMATVYAFARRLRMRAGASWLAGLAFLIVPMVVTQSVMEPNDIVGSALLMIAITLASAPRIQWNRGRMALAGLALGLTAVTKLALLPCVAGAGMFVVAAILLRDWQAKRWRQSYALLAVLAVMFLAAVAPWWARNLVRFQNPIYPSAIPFLGRGVFLADLGRIDISFVPSPLAWPAYPLIEPYDDRSGFGALFLIGAVPGFFFAAQRARRQPLALFATVSAVMLPAWWIFTLHEPRFFLGLVGLSFAFIPWMILATPRRWRWAAGLLVVAAALFTSLVTFDQALLPLARQSNNRADFYNQVWGVDPYTDTLPESDGLLLNTGLAPTIFEYAAFYPLLGPQQARLVIPVDGQLKTETIVAKMHQAGVRYAYVAASPENRAAVEAEYSPEAFDLVHESDIVVGEQIAARRVTYHPAGAGELATATRRYLFRLK